MTFFIKRVECDDECDEYIARNALAWFTMFLKTLTAGNLPHARLCHMAANNPGMWCADRDAIERRIRAAYQEQYPMYDLSQVCPSCFYQSYDSRNEREVKK